MAVISNYDYIIVGSGIAGLYCALLAQKQGSVLLITKGSIEDCNTRHAQGGIAAAIGINDSPELHFKDTIAAGDGLCNEEVVHILANEASDRIADLVHLGVPFDTLDGEIALTLEAAHSIPRILHAGGDATGEHIEITLSRSIRAANIPVLEHHLATEIIIEQKIVKGIEVFDCENRCKREFECRYLILATGGAGQLFKFTTNPLVATGDGIALALKAGAEVMDMEFFQFHPTALHIPGVVPFLISEAVRGEGGILKNVDGTRFMPAYTQDAELAPRDVVARSIVSEMKKTHQDNVFLDVTHLAPQLTATRFPHIYQFCLDQGLDITRQFIPVAPAAHYMIGGIRVNSWGETSVSGLFAAGEVAGTGAHGANRLASNSMLEVLIFGKRIFKKIAQGICESDSKQHRDNLPNGSIHHKLRARPPSCNVPMLSLEALQSLLWDNVGIVRNMQGLAEAVDILGTWQHSLPELKDRRSYELANMVLTGRLMAEAAFLREESRGAHFRSDFPARSTAWLRHIITTFE
ncbi:MAG: L-aspartate oxidase [Dehalococcoidales bacterium]|nr:L-aspartate oxidase [Dehalococcoidales bacterium]